MKYKDKEIGVPTFEQFSKIVSEVCGKSFSAEILYKTLYGRKWKTKNGKPISDLERTLKGMCGSIGKWSYFTKETQERIKESKRRFRENKTTNGSCLEDLYLPFVVVNVKCVVLQKSYKYTTRTT